MTDETCHCGRPVTFGYDGDPTHHRGMCKDCDAIRCDAYPLECPYTPVQVVTTSAPDPGRSVGEGTGQTGWHMHDITGTVHQAAACFLDDAHPVILLDPVTARDTIARVVVDRCRHTVPPVNEGVGCPICNETIEALVAALASQERGE